MSLRDAIQTLTNTFVDQLMDALKGAQIGDLVGNAPARIPVANDAKPSAPVARKSRTTATGRLKRRSAEDITKAVSAVRTLLAGRPAGLRAENIRQELKLDVREVPRILKEGIATKSFFILSGKKRATTYGAKSPRSKS